MSAELNRLRAETDEALGELEEDALAIPTDSRAWRVLRAERAAVDAERERLLVRLEQLAAVITGAGLPLPGEEASDG